METCFESEAFPTKEEIVVVLGAQATVCEDVPACQGVVVVGDVASS